MRSIEVQDSSTRVKNDLVEQRPSCCPMLPTRAKTHLRLRNRLENVVQRLNSSSRSAFMILSGSE